MPHSHSGAPVQINPPWLERAKYVQFLNQSFGGQWNGPSFDWYMAREFNSQRTEILVRADGCRVLSGMTLCYRQVVVGDAAPIGVVILSAAATLAAERGQGHYPALLQAALGRCRENACAAALGFVTHENVSGHGLTRLGARAIPSFYMVSPPSPRAIRASTARPLRPASAEPPHRRGALLSAFESLARLTVPIAHASGAARARFHYERAEDWRRQFLHRPHTVRVARLGHDSYAAIEAVHETDRLQLLVCPEDKRAGNIAALAAASAATGRRFFMYTLDPAEAAAARRARLRIRAGYLMLQPTGLEGDGWDRLARAVWRVQSGDRM
jgi:hypothetical protein